LTISCDISECTHATTHTLDVPMRIAQPRQEEFIHCRDFHQQVLRRGGRLSRGSKLAHAFAIFLYNNVGRLYIVPRALGLEFCMILFHDP
jgi:hypothetical protein